MKKIISLIIIINIILGITIKVEAQDNDINNSYLEIMRINKEGIEPNFNKEIFEYYVTTEEDINELEITAIPENKNSKVEIIGNKNFKYGTNIIEIKVQSQKGDNSNVYKIYLTKTKNVFQSNCNLETLAIENAILYPEFDKNLTHYETEVDNIVNNVNLLAIPENTNAKVTISRSKKLEIGDNPIIVNVLSEDGLSYKKYELNIHRRTEKEQQDYEEEKNKNSERLNILLNNRNKINNKDSDNYAEKLSTNIKQKNNITTIKILFIIVGISILVGAIIYIKYKKK